MVISSGLPYAYASGSWSGAETGKFAFHGQLIQPSAIHFEEGMFALKSEFNRVVHRESGYRLGAGAPEWWTLKTGRFYSMLNNRASGAFDPHPSGWNLGGQKQILFSTLNGDNFNATLKGAFHQKVYIDTMRQLANYIFATYGTHGSWATGAGAAEKLSGVKQSWLKTYKGYNDNYANSGLWFLNNEDVGEDTYRSGMYDRHLDEVRLQPIPHFGQDDGLSPELIDHQAPWGQTRKLNHHEWQVIRPRYFMTNGTIPSGWPSGTEIGRYAGGAPTGLGGHLVSGALTISGGGAGLDGNIYLVTGVYSGAMQNDTYPDSPCYCAYTSLGASGASSIVSGQYQIVLGNYVTEQLPAFPWGTGLTMHESARWPWEGEYEPKHGRLVSTNSDYIDTNIRNQSFWVTNHMFAIQGDHGGTSANPRLSSGIYWFQLNQGPSHTVALLDAWTIESQPTTAVIGGFAYESGIIGLWGKTKTQNVRTQVSETAHPVQFMVGGGWDYDRANNYYFKVGWSGLTTTSNEASGIYANFNQQMVFKGGGVFQPATFGSNVVYIRRADRAVEDGTHKWLLSCRTGSGTTNDPLASDEGFDVAWLRLDSSLAIQDGMLFGAVSTLDTSNFWPVYLRGNAEYIGLRPDSSTSGPNKLSGSGCSYWAFSAMSWGNLQNSDSNGSGSYTKTRYVMTFDSSLNAYINRNENAAIRMHIGTFFETEPDNHVYCTMMAFASGAQSGTGNIPDFWICKVDASSHPFNVTNVWRLGSAGTTYANASVDTSIADIDIGSLAHFEVHVNG